MVAADLPDPGEPIFVPLSALLGSFLWGGVARARREPPEVVQEATLRGGFWGAALGIALYGFGLVTGLY